MQIRRVRVQIDTASQRITGTLQLPNEGYRSRVTDFMNAHETGFFALTSTEIDDGRSRKIHDYVAVGARHIVSLVELEDLGVCEDDEPEKLPSIGTTAQASTPPPGTQG